MSSKMTSAVTFRARLNRFAEKHHLPAYSEVPNGPVTKISYISLICEKSDITKKLPILSYWHYMKDNIQFYILEERHKRVAKIGRVRAVVSV